MTVCDGRELECFNILKTMMHTAIGDAVTAGEVGEWQKAQQGTRLSDRRQARGIIEDFMEFE